MSLLYIVGPVLVIICWLGYLWLKKSIKNKALEKGKIASAPNDLATVFFKREIEVKEKAELTKETSIRENTLQAKEQLALDNWFRHRAAEEARAKAKSKAKIVLEPEQTNNQYSLDDSAHKTAFKEAQPPQARAIQKASSTVIAPIKETTHTETDTGHIDEWLDKREKEEKSSKRTNLDARAPKPTPSGKRKTSTKKKTSSKVGKTTSAEKDWQREQEEAYAKQIEAAKAAAEKEAQEAAAKAAEKKERAKKRSLAKAAEAKVKAKAQALKEAALLSKEKKVEAEGNALNAAEALTHLKAKEEAKKAAKEAAKAKYQGRNLFGHIAAPKQPAEQATSVDLAYIRKAKEIAEFRDLYRFDLEKPEPEPEIDGNLWDAYAGHFRSNPALEMYRGTKDTSWVIPFIKFNNQNSKQGFPYYALYDYYPKKHYPHVPAEIDQTRRAIWNFKDGHNSAYIAKLIASALYEEFREAFQGWTQENTVFCVIPASSSSKTEIRFLHFCSLVATYLGVRNGYKAIVVTYDRAALKGSAGVNKTENLTYDASLFTGKHVLLFDDVKTSGGSFIQNAHRLKALGAANVTGVFLGETYDSYAKGTPSWTNSLNQHQAPAPAFYSNSIDNDLPF